MPRAYDTRWPADELRDALDIAADRTLSWEEVAEALHARDPERRQRRQGPAVRVYLRNHSPIDLSRTLDGGARYRSDVAPVDPAELLGRALEGAREEGRRAILDDLRALVARHSHPVKKKD